MKKKDEEDRIEVYKVIAVMLVSIVIIWLLLLTITPPQI